MTISYTIRRDNEDFQNAVDQIKQTTHADDEYSRELVEEAAWVWLTKTIELLTKELPELRFTLNYWVFENALERANDMLESRALREATNPIVDRERGEE